MSDPTPDPGPTQYVWAVTYLTGSTPPQKQINTVCSTAEQACAKGATLGTVVTVQRKELITG